MPLDLTIALDAMGGDYGPSEIIPAALFSLKKYKQLNLILVGKEEILCEELKKHNSLGHERISISHASEIVTMDEPPSQALRSKWRAQRKCRGAPCRNAENPCKNQ